MGHPLPAVTRAQIPASELGRVRKRDRVLRAGKDLVRRVSHGMQSAVPVVLTVLFPCTTDASDWVNLLFLPSPLPSHSPLPTSCFYFPLPPHLLLLLSPPSPPPASTLPSPPSHQIGDLSADLGPLGRHGLRRPSFRRRSSHLRPFQLHK